MDDMAAARVCDIAILAVFLSHEVANVVLKLCIKEGQVSVVCLE